MEVVFGKPRVKVSTDEDWGLHKAEEGCTIIVDVELPEGVYTDDAMKEMYVEEAREKLGYEKFYSSVMELWERCEDGDNRALDIDILSDELLERHEGYELVKVTLSHDDSCKITDKYGEGFSVPEVIAYRKREEK